MKNKEKAAARGTDRREALEDRRRHSLDWLGDNRRQHHEDRRDDTATPATRVAPASDSAEED